MKFGDLIQTINRNNLSDTHLQTLGNRYDEKFDNCFSRLFHDNFHLANQLKMFNSNSNNPIKECCNKLLSVMDSIEKVNGWLFKKCSTILNKVLATEAASLYDLSKEIPISFGASDTFEYRPKKDIINDFRYAINLRFPPNNLLLFNHCQKSNDSLSTACSENDSFA